MAIKLNLAGRQISVPWTLMDRMIQSVAPSWAAKRLQDRVGHEVVAQMGGFNGASRSRRSLASWHAPAGDADSAMLWDLPTVRDRCSDLLRNSPVAGGAINTTVTRVVGSGLSLMSMIDNELLGLDDDQADAWQQDVERKFNAWWESTDCDITRTSTGYGLQDLTLRGELERGDCFAVLTEAPFARGPVRLAIQLIEGDRCCNRDRTPDRPGLVAGVVSDENGAPRAYQFASGHPDRRHASAPRLTWREVPAFGSRTGSRTVLHVFRRLRVGQTRGVPFLAPVIEPLKQLERYTEAELMAAVVSGMFTVFIKSEAPASIAPSALTASAPQPAAGGWNNTLGNGLVVELGQNEDISTANPGRPNAQFDPFVLAIIRQIGLVLEIPYEVLIKHYSSSFSASRAALLDAWAAFKTRRARLAEQFCQPIYEAWLDEAVAVGYVRAPGYFSDPMRRRAWRGAEWIGDGPGAIDPLKDVNAAGARVDMHVSTLESESIALDGVRLRRKLKQRARELRLMERLGIPSAAPRPAAAAPGQPAPDDDDRDDDDTENESGGRRL
jgi:lambda family phage portal protein